jgi:putative methyltransferase (TIGR04325 family)
MLTRQGIRSSIVAVTPDFALRLARRALGRNGITPPASSAPAPHPWEYLPDGWNTRDEKIEGWNVPSVAATQESKWNSFVDSLQGPGPLGVSHEAPAGSGREDTWAHNVIMSYAYVLALASRFKTTLSMLDWGGGAGHYYPLSKAILPGVELNYFCVDVPRLAEVGQRLVPDGHFFADEASCFERTYDLVHAGSSLWYSEDWQGVVSRLASAANDYLYVTRMMFVSDADSFVAVQRPASYGYLTEYKFWILNRSAFVQEVERHDMTLLREFVFGRGPQIHAAPEQADFRGYLFRRTASEPAAQ